VRAYGPATPVLAQMVDEFGLGAARAADTQPWHGKGSRRAAVRTRR
jgi:hypothetical protein